MGMDNGGPSVGALYAGAGPEGRPADTGMEMGRELYGAELAARTRYTDPLVGRSGECCPRDSAWDWSQRCAGVLQLPAISPS